MSSTSNGKVLVLFSEIAKYQQIKKVVPIISTCTYFALKLLEYVQALSYGYISINVQVHSKRVLTLKKFILITTAGKVDYVSLVLIINIILFRYVHH